MKDILVYATPYNFEKEKWGYKWIGVCNGKRFVVLLDPCITEINFDTKNENYLIGKNQELLLPKEIQKIIRQVPLSNRYFLMGKGKSVSIEVVVMLIETGYCIQDIIMQNYHKFTENGINPETYLCRYIERETGNIIAEILEDETVIWKGDDII